MPPQKAISIEQKINLQQYKAAIPSLSLKSLQSWFESRHSHSISISSVQEIISPQYIFLDSFFKRPTSLKQIHHEHWLKLEAVLYKWISQAEKDIPKSADIIWAKDSFIGRECLFIARRRCRYSVMNGYTSSSLNMQSDFTNSMEKLEMSKRMLLRQ